MSASPREGASAPKPHRRGIQAKTDIGQTNIPGNREPIQLPISGLTIDPEIQQRARIDEALITEYAETIAAWIDSAPIVVFSDGQTRWIADGFQRTEAASRAGLYAVPALKLDGGRQDALRYALGANATHGRRRNREDLERAYQTTVREGFCQATDTECVAALLKCSGRWASELTKAAREAAKVARDAEIQRLAEEGKTQREIAGELGIPKSTVDRLAPKRKTSEMGQAGADPAPATDHAQGDTDPEPVIVEEIEGDDLGAIRGATAKLQAKTTPAATPDPAPATPPAKGLTAKDAMHAAHGVTAALGSLRRVEDALLESDARTLIGELRKALNRLLGRFGEKEVQNG